MRSEDSPDSSLRLKQHWDTTWTSDYSVEERITDPYIGIRDSGLLLEVLENLWWRAKPRILEAGCGVAIWQVELERYGHSIIGIDSSLAGLKAAATYKGTLSLVNGDILQFPFRDASFDAVLSWGVVEHFEDLNLLTLSLREKTRILKLGGRLFITVPAENLFIRMKSYTRTLPLFRLFTSPDPPFFEHKFRVPRFLEMLQRAGFTLLTWRYHAAEFGLANTIPGLFQARGTDNKYMGLSLFGKIIYACVVRWFPLLTAHQIFAIAEKRSS